METTTNPDGDIEIPSKQPRLSALKAELDWLITHAGFFYSRAGLYYDTRYSLWAGQDDDGRKHADNLDDAPFPWEGASDTRVRLADRIIKERKRICKSAFWGKRCVVRGVNSTDNKWAATSNTLLKWLLYVHDPKAIKRELNLGWSFRDCYGAAIMGTFWRRETRAKELVIQMDELIEWATQALAGAAGQEQEGAAQEGEGGDPAPAALIDAIMDPLQDEVTANHLHQFFPDTTIEQAKKAIKNLRDKGTATIMVPEMKVNEPRWMALRPFIDVFFDPNADSLQDCRLIVYREFVTASQLQDRVKTEGYRSGFVAKAIKQKGKMSFKATDPRVMATITRSRYRSGTLLEDTQELIELQHCYYKTNAGKGTQVWCTVMHHDINDDWALHEPTDYNHGEYPFDDWRFEEEERCIMESRGVPEIVMTWQDELKKTRDFHADRMSIDVLPPLLVPKKQAGQAEIGPAQQLERSRSGDYEFLQIPSMGNASLMFTEEVRREVCDFFGMGHPAADPIMVQAAKQELATDTLIDCVPVIKKTFQLAQQFLSDEEIAEICGLAGLQIRAGTQDIQGRFSLEFTFDVRSMDVEFLKIFGEFFTQTLVPLDRAGTLDFAEVVAIGLEVFDPNIASRVQRSSEQVTMADVNDEQNEMAKILVGLEPQMKQVTNAQMRLQMMLNAEQSNPKVQQGITQDQQVAALWENRKKMLKFSLAQQQNAETGKFGAQPVLGGDGTGMPQLGGPGGGGPPQGVSRLDQMAGIGGAQ